MFIESLFGLLKYVCCIVWCSVLLCLSTVATKQYYYFVGNNNSNSICMSSWTYDSSTNTLTRGVHVSVYVFLCYSQMLRYNVIFYTVVFFIRIHVSNAYDKNLFSIAVTKIALHSKFSSNFLSHYSK